MKINNKMIGSRMTQTALLLGALLCAQNLKACWIAQPIACADGYSTGNCSGENPTYQDAYVTGASLHDVCVSSTNNDAALHCYTSDVPISCTYTIHVDACDGSSLDIPSPTNITVDTVFTSGQCSIGPV